MDVLHTGPVLFAKDRSLRKRLSMRRPEETRFEASVSKRPTRTPPPSYRNRRLVTAVLRTGL
jgi:hypothetical protein